MDTNTPEGIGNDGPLSLDEGIRAFAKASSEEVQEDHPEDEDAEAGEEAELSDDEEEDGEPLEEDDAEDSDEEEEVKAEGRFVSKDGKVKMPDGSTTTIHELIRGNLREADYTRKTQEAAAAEKQAAEYRENLSQYEQRVSFMQDMTMAMLEAKMPKAPDRAKFNTDPFGYMEDKLAYDQAREEYETFRAQLNYQREHKATLDAQERERAKRAEEAALYSKIPELDPKHQDPTAKQKVIGSLVKAAEKYGISPKELAEVTDHRVLVALRDLARLASLQGEGAAKVKEKIANKPPVATGSKRLSSGAQRGRAVDAAMQRLNKSGSLKDGIAAYLATQKQR